MADGLNPRCKNCPLLFCDFVSRECRLTPAEVARFRPDMLKDATVVLSDDTPRDYVTLTRRRGYFKSRHAAKYVPLSKDELSAIRRAAAIKGNETRKQRRRARTSAKLAERRTMIQV